MLRLPITEASAKVRTGGPVDDDEDLALPIWAGQLPVSDACSAPPIADPDTARARTRLRRRLPRAP